MGTNMSVSLLFYCT